MDPTATLIALLSAIESDDRDYVREHVDALRGWIDGGGFLPRVGIQRHAHKVVVTIETGQ